MTYDAYTKKQHEKLEKIATAETKRDIVYMRRALSNYRWCIEMYGWRNIYQAYKGPSNRKVNAYYDCRNLCDELHGGSLTVVSANCQMFSVGFQVMDQVENQLYFVYITAYRIVKLPIY